MSPAERLSLAPVARAFPGLTVVKDPALYMSERFWRSWNALMVLQHREKPARWASRQASRRHAP